MTSQGSVLVVSSDLMSAVRVVDTAASLGYAARNLDVSEALDEVGAEIVVIDIANAPAEPSAAVSRLRAANPSARFIAVYRHTEPEQARAARNAGCDLVLNRAQFFGDIGAALARVRGGISGAANGE